MTDGRVTTGYVAPLEIFRLHDPKLSIIKAAGVIGQDVTIIRDDGTPVRTRAYSITEGLFEVFGLPMTLGSVTTSTPTQKSPPARRSLAASGANDRWQLESAQTVRLIANTSRRRILTY
jgi:hypothetical protein